jgi:hypothetical protein
MIRTLIMVITALALTACTAPYAQVAQAPPQIVQPPPPPPPATTAGSNAAAGTGLCSNGPTRAALSSPTLSLTPVLQCASGTSTSACAPAAPIASAHPIAIGTSPWQSQPNSKSELPSWNASLLDCATKPLANSTRTWEPCKKIYRRYRIGLPYWKTNGL